MVSDNATDLTSNAILKWQEERKVEWHDIAPGKPMQNGLVETLSAGSATSASMSISSPACAMPAI